MATAVRKLRVPQPRPATAAGAGLALRAREPRHGADLWIGLAALHPAGGAADYEAARKAARRRAVELRRESGGLLARIVMRGGRRVWELRGDAPWRDGLTVVEYVSREVEAPKPRLPIAPPGSERWSEAQWARALDSDAIRQAWGKLKVERPGLADRARWGALVEREGPRLERIGCGSLATLYRVLRRTDARRKEFDGNVDARTKRRDWEGEAAPGSLAFRQHVAAAFLTVYCGVKGTLKPAYKAAAGEAIARGETPPSYRSVLRWVNREFPHSTRSYFTLGERKWLREVGCESVRRDRSTIRPGQYWSGDGHKCDFLVLHEGKPVRPTLVHWMDMASNVVTCWALVVRATAETLVSSLGRGVLEHGAPRDAIIDNGSDYKSRSFSRGFTLNDEQIARVKSVLDDIGIVAHFCWPFNPGSKPNESWFKILCDNFSRSMPTYCGGRPDARPADLYERLRRGGTRVPTLNEAEGLLRGWLEAYHAEPQEALGGLTPREAAAADALPKRTAPEHVVRFACMARTVVTVGRGGTVRLDGIKYGQGLVARGCRELFDRIGQQVMLRYDTDRSRVLVCDLEGRVLTEAHNERLTGATSDDVRTLRRRQKAARRAVREAAAVATLAHADLSVAAMNEGRRRYAEAQTAKRLAGGERPARVLTPLPGAGALLEQLKPVLPVRIRRPGERESHPLDDAPSEPRSKPIANPLDSFSECEADARSPGTGECANPLDLEPEQRPFGTDAENPLDALDAPRRGA